MLMQRRSEMVGLSDKTPATARPAHGAGPVLLALTGLAAAFAVASCCALPLFLATAGLGTAWLTGIALLSEPHRVFLLGAAACCLLPGAVLLWRHNPAAA